MRASHNNGDESTALARSLTHLFNLRSCGEMYIEKPQLFEKSTELAAAGPISRWHIAQTKITLFTNKANLDIGSHIIIAIYYATIKKQLSD